MLITKYHSQLQVTLKHKRFGFTHKLFGLYEFAEFNTNDWDIIEDEKSKQEKLF